VRFPEVLGSVAFPEASPLPLRYVFASMEHVKKAEAGSFGYGNNF
jgi:hypothetical protein